MLKVNDIVIVGGGSAGWMSAATYCKLLDNKNITVIESPDVPTVSVGESTLAFIKSWLFLLGIDDEDFMKEVDASYKLSIKFTDFYEKDYGSFHYPFGEPSRQVSPLGEEAWSIKKLLNPNLHSSDYCRSYFPQTLMIEDNKINKDPEGILFDHGYVFERASAFHFDAAKFGIYLRDKYCKPRGVNHIAGTVKSVITNEDGVEKLILDDGSEIKADLYIDCTGFSSELLAKALNEPFVSYSDRLPNNKAWATKIPYINKEKELEPYTNSTAINNGWVWNIPLWSRIGTGYVYSDKYISKEDALKEFKEYLKSDKMTIEYDRDVESFEYKDITMRVGIHERIWVKNVLAIGLSAGFVEPLESNGLYTVHEFLIRSLQVLDRKIVTQCDIDLFNYVARVAFDAFATFVYCHYLLSVRTDTQYWRDVHKRSIAKYIDFLDDGNIFGKLIKSKVLGVNYDFAPGISCIANGMNYNPMTKSQLLQEVHSLRLTNYKSGLEEQEKIWQQFKMFCKEFSDSSPTLYRYLKDTIYR